MDKKPNNNLVERKEKTPVEEFISELNSEEKAIFDNIKSTLINKCELLEFEAINEELFDDYIMLMTYIKNGVVKIESDGVSVKLRRAIVNAKGDEITKEVKVLYDENEDLLKQFTKSIKIKKNNINSQTEYTRACVAASLEKVNFNGISIPLSPGNISKKRIHSKDYILLLTCYNFFRN